MEIISKLSIMILTMAIAGQSMATTSSSTIPIDGGTLAAGGLILIHTNKLYPNAFYTVSCNIKNENTNADERSYAMFEFYKDYTSGYIDGRSINSGKPVTFLSSGSLLRLYKIKKDDSIYITNLDFTDSYSIYNCQASIY